MGRESRQVATAFLRLNQIKITFFQKSEFFTFFPITEPQLLLEKIQNLISPQPQAQIF